MKKTRLLAALLALIAILVLALLLLPREEKKIDLPVEETVPVVVAIMDIRAFETITAEMLTVREYPVSVAPQNAYTDPQQVAGARALAEIRALDPILEHHILTVGETPDQLALGIPEGMRAMTVSVDDVSGVSELLRVGDRVDVVVATKDIQQGVLDAVAENRGGDAEQAEISSDRFVGMMLLQDLEVLALNQSLQDAPLASEISGDARYYQTVTLGVAPEDSVKLAWAFNDGRVYLILRAHGEDAAAEVQPYRAWDALGTDLGGK